MTPPLVVLLPPRPHQSYYTSTMNKLRPLPGEYQFLLKSLTVYSVGSYITLFNGACPRNPISPVRFINYHTVI